MKFFSYDPETGFETHSTEELAKAAAIESIDKFREDAPDGWDDSVENVCWGEIRQGSAIVSREHAPEDSGFDEIIDYGLVDIE